MLARRDRKYALRRWLQLLHHIAFACIQAAEWHIVASKPITDWRYGKVCVHVLR
jgi:hypothetical protein